MKNKICVNAKYFKASQVESLQGHVMRLFAEDKNAHAHLSSRNFGTADSVINDKYKDALTKVKGIKSNSNTLIDAVLVFPLEQWREMIKSGAQREEITRAIEQTMDDIQAETGLTPLGFKMHLDEGKIDENGKVILNPHAHLQFANVCTTDVTLKLTKKVTLKGDDGKALRDPDKPQKWLYELGEDGKPLSVQYDMPLKGKMPLQYLRGRGSNSVWSLIQDLAGNNLKSLGFERGESKEITQKKHLEKHALVAQELKKSQAELLQTKELCNQLVLVKNQLERENATIRDEIKNFFLDVTRLASAAIRGEMDAVRGGVKKIIHAFKENDSPQMAELMSICVHKTTNSISDSIDPAAKPVIEDLKDEISRPKLK